MVVRNKTWCWCSLIKNGLMIMSEECLQAHSAFYYPHISADRETNTVYNIMEEENSSGNNSTIWQHERMKQKRDDMERQENKDRLGWDHDLNGVFRQPLDQTCTCVGRPLGWMTAASRSPVVGPGGPQ
jgi:hypothetical protein